MRSKFFKLIRFLFFAFFLSVKLNAQTITENTPLDFGIIIPDINGGTVELTSVGVTQNVNGTATIVSNGVVGELLLSGTPNSNVMFILLPGTLSGPGGNINTFLSRSPTGGITLDSFGQARVNIFGRVDYNAGQAPGIYSGNFNVWALFWSGFNFVTESFPMQIEIKPIDILVIENQVMDFGIVTTDTAGGVARLGVTDNISAASGNLTFGGSALSGDFDIYGTPNSFVNISFSSGNVLTGPGADMPLNNFTVNLGNLIQLNNAGNVNIKTGADLNINPNQTQGSYSGTYTITVVY